MRVRGTTVVVPPRENGRRLAHLRRLGDGDGEIALRHRDHRHAHVAAHDDDAGAFVDHDLGGEIRLDLELLDFGEQRDHVAAVLLRDGDADGARVQRLRRRHADKVVDGGGNALGGGEIGIAQRHAQLVLLVEIEFDLALDQRAVGDAADRRHAAHDLGGFAFGLETADRHRPLADRVDVAVGAEQGGYQQHAALQALAVAERGHGDVDTGALGAKRGQVRRHHHGGDVAGAQGLAADIDAQALQHRGQRLLGERDVVEGVAGAVEADHQAVADELVLAHALDIGEVFDARGRPGVHRDKQHGQERRQAMRPETSSSSLLPNVTADCHSYANAVPSPAHGSRLWQCLGF